MKIVYFHFSPLFYAAVTNELLNQVNMYIKMQVIQIISDLFKS